MSPARSKDSFVHLPQLICRLTFVWVSNAAVRTAQTVLDLQWLAYKQCCRNSSVSCPWHVYIVMKCVATRADAVHSDLQRVSSPQHHHLNGAHTSSATLPCLAAMTIFSPAVWHVAAYNRHHASNLYSWSTLFVRSLTHEDQSCRSYA